MGEQVTIRVSDGIAVSALAAPPLQPDSAVVAYAPGAGSSLRDPFGPFLERALGERGYGTLRFQFPYQEHGGRRPDNSRVLLATWRAAAEVARSMGGHIVASGRSMGGRMASMAVAQGMRVDRLVLFAYPLHPPGKPDRLRDEHLAAILVPTLFCSGTRDAYGSPPELEQAVAKVPSGLLQLLDGADHGFNTLKSSGRTREDVWREAGDALVAWMKDR